MTNQPLFNDVKKSISAYCDAEFNFAFDPAKPIVRLHEPTFGAEEISAFTETMLTTFVTMGKKVKGFEKEAAKEFGTDYCVMNNSGSSANLLAVAALSNPVTPDHLKADDEVIVPALSWSTTVWPLVQHGLVPVFVDCDLESFNFDMNKLEAAITPKTKAIMLVHVYGNPCDMDGIMSLAKKHNLHVIEDCCEAMGAQYKGKPVGSIGRVGTFSLYFSHHITSMEGGLCVTSDFDLTETMRVLRAHGWSREADEHQKYVEKYPDIDPRFIFINQGYNLRPMEGQAAMASVQLPKLKGICDIRRDNADYFGKSLAAYGDYFYFQKETPECESVWFGFPLVVKENAPFTSADLSAYLKERNIENRPIIAGNMPRHPAFKMYEHRVAGEITECNKIMDRGLAFGCHHAIDSKAREYVVGVVEEFMKASGVKAAA